MSAQPDQMVKMVFLYTLLQISKTATTYAETPCFLSINMSQFFY